MFNIVKKILAALSFLKRSAQVTPVEAALQGYLAPHRPPQGDGSKLMLVQCVEDIYYLGLFGRIAASLGERQDIRVEQFVLRTANVAEGRSLIDFIFLRLFFNRQMIRKWTKLYGAAFCHGEGYRNNSFELIGGDCMDLVRSFRLWRKLSSREMLTQLEITGVPVGDLINDTYLRFKPSPTVELRDSYLLLMIWQAYRDLRRARKYFRQAKPHLFLSSYSTYTQHGIAVRVALKEGVRVVTFGNYQEFAKTLSLSDWMHTKNTDDYLQAFQVLSHQEAHLSQAKSRLDARISGKIDAATAYMKASAYVQREELTIDASGAVIVFLHDFFDSPNVYYDMVFPDFWEWAECTIRTLRDTGIKFLVKPHPNQVKLGEDVLNRLRERFPEVVFVSPGITNKQLVDAGVVCAVTAYGTVAHEMAYLGVPSVMCARHPHVAFDFCVTARSHSDYVTALKTCLSLKRDPDQMRLQSMMFYYMHNLNYTEDELQLLDLLGHYRGQCAAADADPTVKDVSPILDEMAALPAFGQFIDQCTQAFAPTE